MMLWQQAANAVTLVRIVLTLPLLFFYEQAPVFVLLGYILLALSDGLDGWLARYLKQESALGAWLDPIADKCLSHGMLGMINLTYPWAWSISCQVLLLGRDLWVSLRRLTQNSTGTLYKVSFLAKIKSALLFVVITILLWYRIYPENWLWWLAQIGLGVATFLAYKTCLDYVTKRSC